MKTYTKTIRLLFAFAFTLILLTQDIFAEIKLVDADTIMMGTTKIRLYGIDAPEKNQICKNSSGASYRCGAMATKALRSLLESMPNQSIKCKFLGEDQYERILGDCQIAKTNINSWLVKNGWALAFRRYSLKYLKHEESARLAKNGMWEGSFTEPWNWRKRAQGSLEGLIPKNTCSIKGNISNTGEKIYHLETSVDYHKTKINLSKGEKWFCSEHAASSQGWRKAKR